jgi:hypothetical protein
LALLGIVNIVIVFCKSVCVQAAGVKITMTSDKNYMFGALSKIPLDRFVMYCILPVIPEV